MAVSMDAQAAINEIEAALEAGADIEGVTSMQGTPVADAEQQITFGGYPNQIGPSLLANTGLINQNANVIDVLNSLHPDFVANASPEELDYAIAVAQGKAKYEEGVLSGPPTMTARQPPWAGSRTQTTGTGPTKKEATAKEIEKYNKAIKKTEESQTKIAKITKELEQQLKNMERWYTSPTRAEALIGPPLPQVAGPTVYSGTPTLVEDESAWGAGSYQPTTTFEKEDPLGQVIASTGHPDWGMSSTPMNPPRMVTRPDGTVEMMEMPIMQSQVPLIDVPKDIKTTKKDTKKTNYGAWKGKFNNLTAKQNLKNLHTFQKARMSDFEKRFGSAKYFGLTRPTVNGKQISWEDNRLRNEYMRTDQFLKDYNAVYGTSKGAKMIGNILSKGVGTVGSMGQNFVNKKGAGNADTFQDVMNKIRDPVTGASLYEGEAEVPAPDPRDKVTGGFWGLMAFAKKHPKIFGPLSGDELWSLISDPDGFWEYYEAALAGD